MGAANVHVSPAYVDEASCNAERVRALDLVAQELQDVKFRVRLVAAECFAVPIVRSTGPK